MILQNVLQINQILMKIKTTGDFQLDWKIADSICSAQSHVEFYQTKIDELIEKYGKRDSSGVLIKREKGIELNEDKITEFSQKVNELNLVEVNFNFEVTLEEIKKCNLEIPDLVFLKQNVL